MRKLSEVIVGELVFLPVGTKIIKKIIEDGKTFHETLLIDGVNEFPDAEVLAVYKNRVTLKMCHAYRSTSENSVRYKHYRIAVLKSLNSSLF